MVHQCRHPFPRSSMRTRHFFLGLVSAFILLQLLPAGPAMGQAVLSSGVPVDVALSSFGFRSFVIHVPEGAESLTVTLSQGELDFDLFVKYGAMAVGDNPSWEDLVSEASFLSVSLGSDEQVVVDGDTSPPIQTGDWYILVANLDSAVGGTVRLTATVETASGETPQGVATGAAATRLSFAINDPLLVPWGHFRLEYQLKSFRPDLRGDLYVALYVEGGPLVFLRNDMLATTSVIPWTTDVPLTDHQGLILAGDMTDALPDLTYTVFAVVIRNGTSLLDFANWLSGLARITFATGNLSGDQTEILRENGYPHGFDIQFDHTARERVETWCYGRDTPDTVYQFVNGGLLLSEEQAGGQERRSAGGRQGAPAQLGPDRFSPATTPEEVRGLLGDPDRVVESGIPGLTRWIYGDAGAGITFDDGVIVQVGVYR